MTESELKAYKTKLRMIVTRYAEMMEMGNMAFENNKRCLKLFYDGKEDEGNRELKEMKYNLRVMNQLLKTLRSDIKSVSAHTHELP